MNRLLLVDGHNLLFQMFFGMPARITNAEGKAIQGTLGFVGALLRMIRMASPTHVAVIFDGERGSSRTALDPAYKANRPDYGEEDDNPFAQLPDVYASLDVLGIRYAETEDCETDDVIAGYALGANENTEVMIASFDSDYFQLISERVSVLRYRGEKTVIWTPDTVRVRLGIEPFQYADYKSLTGDTADNIRGAQGIGPKTAAALLGEFGTLHNMLNHAQEIRKPAVRHSIAESRERLLVNYRLIHLEECDELPYPLDALLWRDIGMTTRGVLRDAGVW